MSSGLFLNDLSSFVWLSWYMSLSWRITESFLFPLIAKIYLHAYEFEMKADKYEEILKYEVSGMYKEVNARRKGFFWEWGKWMVLWMWNEGFGNEVDVVKE